MFRDVVCNSEAFALRWPDIFYAVSAAALPSDGRRSVFRLLRHCGSNFFPDTCDFSPARGVCRVPAPNIVQRRRKWDASFPQRRVTPHAHKERLMVRVGVKRLLLSVCCLVLTLGMGMPAAATDYPDETIQLLVPWSAGDDSDASMRIFAQYLTEELGKPVVVVNVPGAVGNLGNRQGKDAAPDGYTVTMIHESVVTSALVGMADFTYQDFEPVANVCYSPMYLAARPDAPWNTAKEMIERAKANPGKMTFGATYGSGTHFFSLDVAYTGKADIKIVGYGGTVERMQGLLGSFIDLGEVNPGIVGDLFSTGKLKMIGSASEERFELTPDIPTLKEQGLPVFIGVTRGVFVPKGTPEPIIARLEEACKKVCDNPEYKEKIKASGSVSYFKSREDYKKLLADMTAHMKTLAETFNILKK